MNQNSVVCTKMARRMRTNAEKQRIVEETRVSGALVADVARRHGVNANLLFNWIRQDRQGSLAECREPATAQLVPVTLSPPPRQVAPADRIELDLPDGTRVRVYGSAITAVISRLLATSS
ncbi:MAG: transposase [Pseudomonadales bacterium]|nr:transposase [Pseudomonadales bacterium]